ncbi:MAG: hypothetical protein ACPG4T_01805 [Nannocystaceae bacterium]
MLLFDQDCHGFAYNGEAVREGKAVCYGEALRGAKEDVDTQDIGVPR